MSKVGIYRIGFKEQNEINDIWVQQEEQQDRSGPELNIDGSHWFKSIDQKVTNLIEELVSDDNGSCYEQNLNFVVRKDVDIKLARKYINRPVVVYVLAVDGNRYTIGTKDYPTCLVTSDRYQDLDTREIAMKVSYKSKMPLLK
jgi:hypothetical protein